MLLMVEGAFSFCIKFACVGIFSFTVKIPFTYRLSRVFTPIGERRTNKTSSKKTARRTAQTIQSEETSRKSEYRMADLDSVLGRLKTLPFLCSKVLFSLL